MSCDQLIVYNESVQIKKPVFTSSRLISSLIGFIAGKQITYLVTPRKSIFTLIYIILHNFWLDQRYRIEKINSRDDEIVF